MNLVAQHIALARLLGWRSRKPRWWERPLMWGRYVTISPEGVEYCGGIPNFDSLDVLHGVEEKLLKWEQRKQYHGILADVAGFSYCEADTYEETELSWNCHICHASAAHRREALLKIFNVWKEAA